MVCYQILWCSLLLPHVVLAVGPVADPAGTTHLPSVQSVLPPITPPEVGTTRPEARGSHVDRLWEEIGGVKAMMSNIAAQLDKFNSLYLGKLEHRMLTTSTLLASVDANIKSLQERSHVWDTFQLHVAAWNEQIKTLDDKVDLLSRGQEKMVVLDTKVTQLMALEYKLEKVANRLEDTSRRINQLESPKDPLMGEFATRGVLSTLKVVERKVDRLQTGIMNINVSLKPKRRRNETEESSGKLVIRCNTPPAVEEALQDVQAKVDLLYDRLVAETDSNELADQPDTTESTNSEGRLLNKLWKRLTTPQRKTAKSLETIEGLVRNINASRLGCSPRNSEKFNEDLARDIQELLSCCRASSHRVTSFADNAETLMKRVEGVANRVHDRTAFGEETLELHFGKQRKHFEDLLKNGRFCSRVGDEDPPPAVPPLDPDYDGSGDSTDDEGSGDDEDIPEERRKDEEPITIVPWNPPRSTPSILDPWRGSTTSSSSSSTTTTDAPPPSSSTSPREGSLTTTQKTLDVTIVDETHCEALVNRGMRSGVYQLGPVRDLNAAGRDFYTRHCDLSTVGGGWTVIQRRGGEWEGRENFTRNWDDYSFGFGSIYGEFWLGNEYIHRLTYETDVTLRVELEDWDGVTAWAEYSTFKVDAEEDNYRMWVSGYEGNATDALGAHDGTPFSTVDRDNDSAPPCCPCAPAYGGGWWFYSCFEANLNGDYYVENGPHESFRGVIWEHWHGDYSLKSTRMLIRPRSLGYIHLDPPDQVYPDP